MRKLTDSPQPPNGRKIVIIVLSLAGMFILLCGGCIALIFRASTDGYSDSKIVGDRFLTTLEHQGYQSAKKEMTSTGQSAAPDSTVEDMLAVLEKRHGKMLKHDGPIDWREDPDNGVTTISLVYTEYFERGKTKVDLSVVGDNDTWRIQGFNFGL